MVTASLPLLLMALLVSVQKQAKAAENSNENVETLSGASTQNLGTLVALIKKRCTAEGLKLEPNWYMPAKDRFRPDKSIPHPKLDTFGGVATQSRCAGLIFQMETKMEVGTGSWRRIRYFFRVPKARFEVKEEVKNEEGDEENVEVDPAAWTLCVGERLTAGGMLNKWFVEVRGELGASQLYDPIDYHRHPSGSSSYGGLTFQRAMSHTIGHTPTALSPQVIEAKKEREEGKKGKKKELEARKHQYCYEDGDNYCFVTQSSVFPSDCEEHDAVAIFSSTQYPTTYTSEQMGTVRWGDGHWVIRRKRVGKDFETVYDLHVLDLSRIESLPPPQNQIGADQVVGPVIEQMKNRYANVKWECRQMRFTLLPGGKIATGYQSGGPAMENKMKVINAATVLFELHPRIAECFEVGKSGNPPLPRFTFKAGEMWRRANEVGIKHLVADGYLGEEKLPVKVRYFYTTPSYVQGEIEKYRIGFHMCFSRYEKGDTPELGPQQLVTNSGPGNRVYVFVVEQLFADCPLEDGIGDRRIPAGQSHADSDHDDAMPVVRRLVGNNGAELFYDEEVQEPIVEGEDGPEVAMRDPRMHIVRIGEVGESREKETPAQYMLVSYRLEGDMVGVEREEAKSHLEGTVARHHGVRLLEKREGGPACFQLGNILFQLWVPL